MSNTEPCYYPLLTTNINLPFFLLFPVGSDSYRDKERNTEETEVQSMAMCQGERGRDVTDSGFGVYESVNKKQPT